MTNDCVTTFSKEIKNRLIDIKYRRNIIKLEV